jgi:hypothetical protein
MNSSVAADALDQGDTDRARTRVRTGRLVLYIASEPSRPPLYALYNSTAARGSMAP